MKIFVVNGLRYMERKKLIKTSATICFNALIFLFSMLGVILACYFAVRDGYSHWTKRLLYFTQLSNIWIGLFSGAFLIVFVLECCGKTIMKGYMYALKYVFTVSITITGIIFCALLAPFADFNVWSFSSVLTHVVVPILSIADLFVSCGKEELKMKNTFFSLIPPAIYFVFASILCVLRVDFGKGDAFPYFFMNFYSEVGLFGFRNVPPRPELGSFYWIVVFLFLIYGLSFAYYKIYNGIAKKRN